MRPVGMYAGTAPLARRSHDSLTMPIATGTTVKVKVSDLTATARRQWLREHPDTDPGACYVTGVVVGRAGAWTHVRFSDAHPEISGNVSLKAGSLQSQGRAPGSGAPGAPRSQPDRRNTDTIRDAELEEDEDVDDAEETYCGGGALGLSCLPACCCCCTALIISAAEPAAAGCGPYGGDLGGLLELQQDLEGGGGGGWCPCNSKSSQGFPVDTLMGWSCPWRRNRRAQQRSGQHAALHGASGTANQRSCLPLRRLLLLPTVVVGLSA